VCPPPAPKAGGGGGGGVGTLSPGGEGVVGQYFNISEDARHWIGLLQCNPSTEDGFGLLSGRLSSRLETKSERDTCHRIAGYRGRETDTAVNKRNCHFPPGTQVATGKSQEETYIKKEAQEYLLYPTQMLFSWIVSNLIIPHVFL
jgi:hypothetical protein